MQLPDYIITIFDLFEKNNQEIYLVGGCVRDQILNHEIHDYDFTTSATPIQMKEIFDDPNFHVIETGIKHGTITVIYQNHQIEITTYRCDNDYQDHRHPTQVAFTNQLREDLARRDFTMNAIAYHPRIGYVDYFHGIDDIKRRQIVAVGDPYQRFEEDALRILRATRFHTKLNFNFESRLRQAIIDQSHLLKYISKERIRDEFFKILECNYPFTLSYLKNLNLLSYILPGYEILDHFEQKNPWHLYDVFVHSDVALNQTINESIIIKLAIILHDIGKPKVMHYDRKGFAHFYGHHKESKKIAYEMLTNLKLDKKSINHICSLIEYHDYPISNHRKIIRRLLAKIDYNYPLLYEIIQVQIYDDFGKNLQLALPKIYMLKECLTLAKQMEKDEAILTIKELAINGHDLINCGYQGKQIALMLQKIHQYVIDDPTRNVREHLLSYINEHPLDE